MSGGEEETKILELEVSEGKPVLFDFGNFGSAVFDRVTIDNVDKDKPTKLIVEYDDIQPESIDSGEIKVNRVVNDLLTFADEVEKEVEIAFHSEQDDNTKFIVEGPGKVVIHGRMGPKGFFISEEEFGEEEEEEEAAEEAVEEKK